MPLLTKNIDYFKPKKLSAFRKIAIGTWQSVGDPSVYGFSELDATWALEHLKKLQAQNPETKLTITHFVGKVIAHTLSKHPSINSVLRFGTLYPRTQIDLFFQVASDTAGNDLSGTCIRNCDQKSMIQIANELRIAANRIRTQNDPDYRRMKNVFSLMPGVFSKYILKFSEFFLYTLNLWSPIFGAPKDPFGSAMITSIGSLGLDQAFAPLVPYSRTPLLIAVGRVQDRPSVENGKVVIKPILLLSVTVDHRYIDGMQGSQMFKTLKEAFENPDKLL